MKVRVSMPQEIEITTVRVEAPVRCGEDDIPNDFPFRHGGVWDVRIDIDTGKIQDWPADWGEAKVRMKVVDTGTYALFGADGRELACIIEDYVPHGLIPGKWGDYIVMDIAADGTITNWPREPSVKDWFPELDD